MPIKPENRARYPKNWRTEIVPAVRARSGGRCECLGECGIQHGPYAHSRCLRINGEFGYRDKRTDEWVQLAEDASRLDMRTEVAHILDGERVVKVVLTVAHLNHRPEDCDMGNLKDMCQRCHNRYDKVHRVGNAQRTVRAKKAVGDFFCD